MRADIGASSLPQEVIEKATAPSSQRLSAFQLIDLRELCLLIVQSRGWVYERLNEKGKYFDPSFPRPINLSPTGTSTRWVLEEVEAWVSGRIKASRQADTQ